MQPHMTSVVLRRLSIAVLIAGAVTVILSGCGGSVPGVDGDASEQSAVGGRVVFDMAHGEVFGADDTSELGQSVAVAAVREAGFAIDVRHERFDSETLSEASGLILPGPMVAFTAEEMDAIEEYLRGGGVVLLTIHVPYGISHLPERFGVEVVPGVIQSARPVGQDPGVFMADQVFAHDLTSGVEEVLVLSSWAVAVEEEDAEVVVASGPDTWLVIHGSEAGEEPEVYRGPLGVIAVSHVGAGTFVVIGDDAVFANVAIDQADNRRLLDNMLQMMAEVTRPI